MDYTSYNYNWAPLDPYSADSTSILMPNRFVYVNQNFHKPRVLVNPNFKKTVHINPNFKGTIHVNPNIMKLMQESEQSHNCDDVDLKSNTHTQQNVYSKSIPIPKTSHLNHSLTVKSKILDSEISEYLKPNLHPQSIANSKSNLNHQSNSSLKLNNVVSKYNFKPNEVIKPVNSRRSLHTKYKIVHENAEVKKVGLNTKYKIDKRVLKKVIKTRIIKSRFKLLNLDKENTFKNRKSKFVNISGILYKKTPNVLRIATLETPKRKVKTKRDLYKFNSNETLKKSLSKKKLLLSQTRNFKQQIFMSKMKKCNIPCLTYRKFGKCYGKLRGTCFKTHNPDQIDLCTRFLQGACIKKNCLLSHKVSPEKVPTCKYYLEGLCTREDCIYLHVKISPKAEICKDFLEGFCKKAQECDKRHQFLCPSFEKSGSCSKKRCPYPHGNTVRKYSLKAKVAKKTIKALKAKIDRIKNKRKRDDEKLLKKEEKGVRYYIDTKGDEDLKVLFEENDNINLGDLNDSLDLDDANVGYKRKALGDLPSFIPLGE